MALRPQHVSPELLTKVTKVLGITALEQWYHIPTRTATRAIGLRVLNNVGGTIAGFLKYAYPHHNFDEEKLASKTSYEKDQKFLEVIVRQLFPNTEIQTKARKTVGIINPETEAYLEIDFWIPSLKLGLEYQDKHHFGHQWYANDSLEDYKKRDDVKKVAMSTLGYTLITIGYWWDKTIDSVAATIRKFRPDLLAEFQHSLTEPISADPPLGFISEDPLIPGVVGIMSPFVPKGTFNPTDWYGGEKHDGIRGVYNPELNKMFSRSGNELSVLSSLLNDIPNILVEGEVIAGRGHYNKTAAVSYHSHHEKVYWPLFRFMSYDIPDAELGNYTQRYSVIIRELFALPFIFAQPAFRVLLQNKDHLKMLLDAIISDTGEGVIAQRDSQYEYGRATGLAKIKVRRDADARVLRINKGSCTCKLVSGVISDITFGAFDPSDLKVGDIISYFHNGYSRSGLPIKGEVYKVRYDITWDQLIGDKSHTVGKRRSFKEAVGSHSLNTQNSERTKMGHWNKAANVRAFFEKFARTEGFDSLVPDNWYSVMYSRLQKSGGARILYLYNFDVSKALSLAYPELKFVKEKFNLRVKKGHWSNASNVRAFFDEFAQSNGFDPLAVDNWYPVRTRTVERAGGCTVLKYLTFKKALSFAYPELKFDYKRFSDGLKPIGHWKQLSNVRVFFDEFASTSGFDPLVSDNWYSVRYSTIHNSGGASLLYSFNFDMAKALSVAYPELKFDKSKFKSRAQKGHWNKSANVRAFLDEFARTNGFDPQVAENWYNVKTLAVKQAGAWGFLKYYNFKQALAFAYPELIFEEQIFRN